MANKTNSGKTFFIGISTYSRLPYLQKLINSLLGTVNKRHNYIVAVNDDGSRDGTRQYLSRIRDTDNIKFVITYSNGQGSHFSYNSLLYTSSLYSFDLGFKIDDDLYFLKPGWEDLYLNAATTSGYYHLSHFSTSWKPGARVMKRMGSVESYVNVWGSQGAFWTFTPEMIKTVGYIDSQNMGRRGGGHVDLSVRACRLGYNNEVDFFDAADSNEYIRLHRKDYILTPGYAEELKIAVAEQGKKLAISKNRDRIFIGMKPHAINFIFEQVYVINLKSRPDRLSAVSEKLNSRGIKFTVVEAVDGNTDHEALRLFKTNINPKLNRAAYGCLLSHRNIYRDAVNNKLHRILILEDDLLFHKDFDEIINKIPKLPKWDMLYLGGSDYGFHKQEINPSQNFYSGKEIDGTFAYALQGHDFIKTVLKMMEDRITKAVDTKLHHAQDRNHCLVMYPNAVIADVGDSNIREARDIAEHSKKLGWDYLDYT